MGILKSLLFLPALLVAGCAPSAIQIGTGIREARGHYRIVSERVNVPYGRIEVRSNLNEKLEGDLHFDYVRGGFGFRDFGVQHDVVGDLEGVGAGLHYFITEEASLDIGADIFRADGDAIGRWPFGNLEVNSTGIGIGGNIGVTKYFSLDKKVDLFVSGGYNLTTECGERVRYDLGGGYGMIGLRINFDK